ncbi:MAG: hypothetical protein P1Q69_16525 [Candidatus Thorarchaeota archaeon]|nr:hypothetical protein [Candidatus Thorarchaeota archaeon]
MKDLEIVEGWFMENLGSSVDVVIGGEIFGGRLGEMRQTIKELELESEKFLIKFGTTERLSVYKPEKVKVGKQNQLIVGDASKAIFGWHHHGLQQSTETWSEIAYVKQKKRIQVTWTGVISDKRIIDYSGDRFVELLL